MFLLPEAAIAMDAIALVIALAIAVTMAGIALWQQLRARASQAQVHFLQHKIETILNNAPIVFSAVDTNGIFHISEGKGLQKLGRKNNQSVGLSIYKMHNNNPIILGAVEKALRGEFVSTSFELNSVTYELFMGPERNSNGKIIGASMLSVDITDRTTAEKEKALLQVREQTAIETSKLKSEFLANMSHEIRTPINGVLGMTKLLLGTKLDKKQKDYAEAIETSGASLLTVINDILDFSKIEAGKLHFEKFNFELKEFFAHTMKSFEFSAKERGIKLLIEIQSDLPAWVEGDPGRFRQILNNLIGNAIKFTPEGQVSIRVTIEPSQQTETRLVRVEVQDSGIGISKENLSKLFSAFTRAESSMSRRFGGTGLGLSISKQLVEKMGGDIGVDSQEGRGSTFWFRIPFKIGQPQLKNQRFTPTAVAVLENSPRVLIAEDNKINQMIAVAMLEQMGCKTELVMDGRQALDALEKNNYDLVLMDCQMPTMDGLQATIQFRRRNSGRNLGIPIIALTANAMTGDKEKCLNVGMDDYVSKPISFEELKSTIIRWLTIKAERERSA